MKQTLLTAMLSATFLGMASAAGEGQETLSLKNVMPSLINDSGTSAITFVTKDGKVSTEWQDWPKTPDNYNPTGFLDTAVFATDAKILGQEEEGGSFSWAMRVTTTKLMCRTLLPMGLHSWAVSAMLVRR